MSPARRRRWQLPPTSPRQPTAPSVLARCCKRAVSRMPRADSFDVCTVPMDAHVCPSPARRWHMPLCSPPPLSSGVSAVGRGAHRW